VITAFAQVRDSARLGSREMKIGYWDGALSGEDVVDMTGAACTMGGPVIEVPESWRARIRQAHPFATQLARYTVVGGLGTVANAMVFLALRTWWEALAANFVALVLSTLLSTEINRRFTFQASASTHRWRTYVQNGGTVVFYAFYSSAVLITLALVVDEPSPWLQALAVSAASVLGGFARFLVLRYWVFEDAHA
jgi:putative flippase GtrA